MRAIRLVVPVFLISTALFGATKWKYVRAPLGNLPENFIRDHQHDEQYALGYVPLDTWKGLSEEAREKLVELDARAWSEGQFDIKTLKSIPQPIRNEFGPFEDYHTYASLTAELKTLAEKFPNLVTLSSAGKTVENREMWLLEISAKDVVDENKPKLLYISSMHGDEVVGKEMMMYLLRDLLNGYGTDARATSLLRNAKLFIIPSMNPDGTERHQRFNANGVDLNRNFPEMDEEAFSTSGRAIETKNIMELHRAHHFQVSANFHTGALCVNLPWDHKPNSSAQKFGDDNLLMSMAKEFAEHNEPMHDVSGGSFHNGVTYGYEWYEVLGGMQDWSSYFRSSSHVTIELSNIKWPSASTLAGFWSNNREALLRYFERGIDGIHLKVVNEQGELVNNVGVDLSSAKRTITYNGFIHRPTIEGPQAVTLKAPGYAAQTLTINPSPFDGTYQTVVLRAR